MTVAQLNRILEIINDRVGKGWCLSGEMQRPLVDGRCAGCRRPLVQPMSHRRWCVGGGRPGSGATEHPKVVGLVIASCSFCAKWCVVDESGSVSHHKERRKGALRSWPRKGNWQSQCQWQKCTRRTNPTVLYNRVTLWLCKPHRSEFVIRAQQNAI